MAARINSRRLALGEFEGLSFTRWRWYASYVSTAVRCYRIGAESDWLHQCSCNLPSDHPCQLLLDSTVANLVRMSLRFFTTDRSPAGHVPLHALKVYELICDSLHGSLYNVAGGKPAIPPLAAPKLANWLKVTIAISSRFYFFSWYADHREDVHKPD